MIIKTAWELAGGAIRHILDARLPDEEGHALSHDIIREIEERLPHSQVLVHIEPCGAECEGCMVACSYRNGEGAWLGRSVPEKQELVRR